MRVFEDQKARYRFLGVLVWFVLLMLFVPSWYANPVNFVPQQVPAVGQQDNSQKQVLFPEAYRLPSKNSSEEDIEQAKKDAKQIAIEDLVIKQKSVQNDGQESEAVLPSSNELKVDRSKFAQANEQSAGQPNAERIPPKDSTNSVNKISATTPQTQPKTSVTEKPSQNTSLPPVKEAGDWLLLLASYPDKKEAQGFMRKLQNAGFSTAMKYYSKQQVYSVRVIGLESRAKAQIVKKKLDKMFNLNDSIIRQNK